jgi:ribokinase
LQPKILNYGSINIDYVYKVPHFVRPGETIASLTVETFAGGKGGNQTTALARAGAKVWHAGKIGPEGLPFKELLRQNGADVTFIRESNYHNGHACIQIDTKGQNAILLFAGANKEITRAEIDETFKHFNPGDYLLLQNEVNLIDYLIQAGREKGLIVCLNPAPMDKSVQNYPLHLTQILIVNETEAQALTYEENEMDALKKLKQLYPETELILTRGAEGVSYRYKNNSIDLPACPIEVVDTTGAGDTFIGYFLAARLEGHNTEYCLKFADQASALCVSKRGAQDSIPTKAAVLEALLKN